jgi:AmpD protein
MRTPLSLDQHGWVHPAQQVVSQNVDARPANATIDLLVLHCISVPPGSLDVGMVEALFTNRLSSNHPDVRTLIGLRVSAHFVIDRRGNLIQFVPTTQRAWHAGASHWRGRDRCNDYSIGIELIGSEFLPFTPAQYQTLNDLVAVLSHAYPVQAVVGHDDIAPGRKFDPGPFFDWTKIDRPKNFLAVADVSR